MTDGYVTANGVHFHSVGSCHRAGTALAEKSGLAPIVNLPTRKKRKPGETEKKDERDICAICGNLVVTVATEAKQKSGARGSRTKQATADTIGPRHFCRRKGKCQRAKKQYGEQLELAEPITAKASNETEPIDSRIY